MKIHVKSPHETTWAKATREYLSHQYWHEQSTQHQNQEKYVYERKTIHIKTNENCLFISTIAVVAFIFLFWNTKNLYVHTQQKEINMKKISIFSMANEKMNSFFSFFSLTPSRSFDVLKKKKCKWNATMYALAYFESHCRTFISQLRPLNGIVGPRACVCALSSVYIVSTCTMHTAFGTITHPIALKLVAPMRIWTSVRFYFGVSDATQGGLFTWCSIFYCFFFCAKIISKISFSYKKNFSSKNVYLLHF